MREGEPGRGVEPGQGAEGVSTVANLPATMRSLQLAHELPEEPARSSPTRAGCTHHVWAGDAAELAQVAQQRDGLQRLAQALQGRAQAQGGGRAPVSCELHRCRECLALPAGHVLQCHGPTSAPPSSALQQACVTSPSSRPPSSAPPADRHHQPLQTDLPHQPPPADRPACSPLGSPSRRPGCR